MLSKEIEEKLRKPFRNRILKKLNVITYAELFAILADIPSEKQQEVILLGDYYLTKDFKQFHALDLEYAVDEEIIKSN